MTYFRTVSCIAGLLCLALHAAAQPPSPPPSPTLAAAVYPASFATISSAPEAAPGPSPTGTGGGARASDGMLAAVPGAYVRAYLRILEEPVLLRILQTLSVAGFPAEEPEMRLHRSADDSADDAAPGWAAGIGFLLDARETVQRATAVDTGRFRVRLDPWKMRCTFTVLLD